MLSTLTICCIQNQNVIYNKTILGIYIGVKIMTY